MATSSAHPTTVKIDAAGHWLRADAAASYLRMIAAGMPAGGIDVFGRTLAEQKVLYERYLKGRGPLAARPSPTAPHVMGVAMDAHTTTAGKYAPSAAHRWLTAGGDGSSKPRSGEKLRAHDYGWRRTVPSERWHFGYDRARDKKRAADLAARLKKLGYKDVKAFQKAHGLTVDGVDGPQTWGALLTNPKPASAPTPKPPAAPAGVEFRAGSYNAELKRFGGGIYAKDAAFVKGTLRVSVLAGQEMDEPCRTQITKACGYKVWAYKTLGVFWDPKKYKHGTRIELDLGTDYHGMIGTPLTSLKNGVSFVAASVHIRPNDAIRGTDAQKLDGKKGDIKRVIATLARYPRVVVGGDWATGHARALLEAAGYRLVTPYVDTMDAAGTQRVDAIYVRGLDHRTGGSVHATADSDHHGLVANLTIPAPIITT